MVVALFFVVTVVVTFVVFLGQHVEGNALRQRNTVFTFALNVKVDETSAFFVLVIHHVGKGHQLVHVK